jgi:hypothetical protein
MANLLRYSRNRCTGVQQLDETTLKSTCRLQDTLTDARVEITVRLPDLEITGVSGQVRRTYREECRDAADVLKKVVGVRIGAGMLKIIKGLVGEETDCGQLGFMVEECCHGVILAFTKETLVNTPRPKEIEEAKAVYADMVRKNVRLYNRCAAFAPGSSLVEGITPPEG